jgi:hypothetical protein
MWRYLPTNRRWRLAPFPIPRSEWREFFNSLHNPDDVAAVEHLIAAGHKSIIRTKNNAYFSLPDQPKVVNSFELEFPWISDQLTFPMISDSNSRNTLKVPHHHPMYDKLVEWMKDAARIEMQEYIVASVANTLIHAKLNTSGQVARLWPEMVNFLPEDLAAELKDAKRDSRLPESITLTDRFWIPHMSNWLAQAVFLKDEKDNDPATDCAYDINLSTERRITVMEAAGAGSDPLGLLTL